MELRWNSVMNYVELTAKDKKVVEYAVATSDRLYVNRSIATFTRPVRKASKSSKTRETPVSKAFLPQDLC